MYYCWWRRRAPDKDVVYRNHVESSSATSSSDQKVKVNNHQVRRYKSATKYGHDRIRNGFFTVPATRVHHNQQWALNHPREMNGVMRYKRKKRLQNGRLAHSDIGTYQPRGDTTKSIDRRSISLHLSRTGTQLPAYSGHQVSAQTMVSGNRNYGYTHDHDIRSFDSRTLEAATLGGATNGTTFINGKPHRYYAGTSTGEIPSAGNYVASLAPAVNHVHHDHGAFISGPVLTSDNIVSTREVLATGSDLTPRSYTTQSTKPLWVVNNSRDRSAEQSDVTDQSASSRISGAVLVKERPGDVIMHGTVTSEEGGVIMHETVMSDHDVDVLW